MPPNEGCKLRICCLAPIFQYNQFQDLIRQILQEPVQGVRRGSGGGTEESPEGGCRGGDFSGLVGERSACIIAITKCNSERVFWPGSWGGHFEGSGGGSGEQVDDTKVLKFHKKY